MDEIIIKSTHELGKISINYAEIEDSVREKVQHYAKVIITEESIPEFTKARAEINKVVKMLSDERIRIKKLWNEPVTAMEAEINRISAIANDSIKNLDDQLRDYEAKRYESAKQTVWEAFQGYGIKDITFEQIFKPEWCNKTNEKKALKLLENECQRIQGDLDFIEMTEDKAEAVLVKENYVKSLDIVKAQSEARITLASVRRAEELRRQAQEMKEREETERKEAIKKQLDEMAPTYQRDTFAESFQSNLFEQPKINPIIEQAYIPEVEKEKQPERLALYFDDIIDYTEAIEALTIAKVNFSTK